MRQCIYVRSKAAIHIPREEVQTCVREKETNKCSSTEIRQATHFIALCFQEHRSLNNFEKDSWRNQDSLNMMMAQEHISHSK